MGFGEKQARDALSKFDNDLQQALNFLITNPSDIDPELEEAVKLSLQEPQPSELMMQQDIEMNKAIIESMKGFGLDPIQYEPLNPESCKRKNGMPVGLKNIGNTCYFNSLIQFYFMIPKLVFEILTFECHPSHALQLPPLDNSKKLEYSRKKASISLVQELQKLMSFMVCSSRKYIDPSKVLNSLVDEFAKEIRVGDQKDVGEFHLILVARIEEGLQTRFEIQENDGKNNIKPVEKQSSPQRKESMNFIGHQISDDSIILPLFNAKQVEYLRIPSTGQELRNEVVFGQIILDVEEKDLYSAWDSSYHCKIDDYYINESTITAEQEIWPQKFPGVLLFQIQRVKYDKISQNSIKIHKKFTFPEEIFTDRFLLKNMNLCRELRTQMLILKNQARKIECQLESFTNYHGSEVSVEKMLRSCIKFLERQENASAMNQDETLTCDNALLENIDLTESKQILNAYKKKVRNSIKEMEKQLERIYENIGDLYNRPELRENKYKLHSILVHDGYAGSGHYYAYVHDIEGNKWRKYSDLIITDVSFDTVITDSIGGNALASAYCLLYVKEDILAKDQLPYWDFDIESMNNTIYYKQIPTVIQKEIQEDNKKLEDEIANFQVSQVFSKIQGLHESRVDEIGRIYSNSNNKIEEIRLALINFPFHLKVSIASSNDLFKKFILDMCVKEITGKNIESFAFTDPLFVKLRNTYGSLVTITKLDKDYIEKERKVFIKNYFDAKICVTLMQYLTCDRFEDVFKGILFHVAEHDNNFSDYARFIKECAKALTLRLTTEAFKLFINGDHEGMCRVSTIIGHLIGEILESSDIICKAAIKRLETLRDEFKNSRSPLFPTYEPFFKKLFADISTYSVIAQVDLTTIPDEIEFIKAELVAFDSDSWFLGNKADDIAVSYVKIKEIRDKHIIKEWFLLAENISRTRQTAEKLFRDVEKSTLVITRN
ncbi:hypothetical protein SteCoe_12844 [Stentor coeruleus]|uniref:Ubiquitin carboxyl-terminal hydrolase n=1 Tax=Stentor coeruleus TaxID=5963 RepID=A0A1R2C9Y0_9CILI|nr:hypothetical protein SteCoe_12844 [Stentor coeruleus]